MRDQSVSHRAYTPNKNKNKKGIRGTCLFSLMIQSRRRHAGLQEGIWKGYTVVPTTECGSSFVVAKNGNEKKKEKQNTWPTLEHNSIFGNLAQPSLFLAELFKSSMSNIT